MTLDRRSALAGLAGGVTQVTTGLSQADQFLEKPEAIAASERFAESFPAGTADPTVVMTTTTDAAEVAATAESVDAVSTVRPSGEADGVARLDVVLDAEPGCDEAVAARGGACGRDAGFELTSRVLPERAGSGSRDRVELPTGTVLDLGANVRELTRDLFAGDDSPCWGEFILRDPACTRPSGDAGRATKGGDLVGTPVPYAAARARRGSQETVGFRCSYPGRP